MTDADVSPSKEEQPSSCCDADTRLDLEVDGDGNYLEKEFCRECGDELRKDTNIDSL